MDMYQGPSDGRFSFSANETPSFSGNEQFSLIDEYFDASASLLDAPKNIYHQLQFDTNDRIDEEFRRQGLSGLGFHLWDHLPG